MFDFSGLLGDKNKKKKVTPSQPAAKGPIYDKRGDIVLSPDSSAPVMQTRESVADTGGISAPVQFQPLGGLPNSQRPMPGAAPAPSLQPRQVEDNAVTWGNQDQMNHLQRLISDPSLTDNSENKMSPFRAGLAQALGNIGKVLLQGGNVGQAIGYGMQGGAEGAFNPKGVVDAKHAQEIARLQPLVEAERDQRKSQLDEQARNQTGLLNYKQKGLDLLHSQNKTLFDSVVADDQVTEDEAKMLNQAGYPVVPYDARKFNVRYENGTPFSSPEKGAPQFKPLGNLPVRQSESEVEYTSPSGNKFKLKQNQAAQFEQAIMQGDATRAMNFLIQNNRIENENIQSTNKAENERAKLLGQRDGYFQVYETSNQQIAQIERELKALQSNPTPDSSLISQKDSQLANARKASAEALGKALELENTYKTYKMPAKLQPIKNVPRLSPIPKTTEAEIRKIMKKWNATPEQIQTAIQAAKDKGVLD